MCALCMRREPEPACLNDNAWMDLLFSSLYWPLFVTFSVQNDFENLFSFVKMFNNKYCEFCLTQDNGDDDDDDDEKDDEKELYEILR